MTNRYEEIRLLILASSDVVDFAEYGDGVSRYWIEKAEAELGLILPPSYKWWLEKYSGGEIGGEEIFSIYEEDFDNVVGGDIVCMHRLNQSKGLFKSWQLAICESDLDGAFYFNTIMQENTGEYPVFSDVTDDVYAVDFLEFLKKRINAAKS